MALWIISLFLLTNLQFHLICLSWPRPPKFTLFNRSSKGYCFKKSVIKRSFYFPLSIWCRCDVSRSLGNILTAGYAIATTSLIFIISSQITLSQSSQLTFLCENQKCLDLHTMMQQLLQLKSTWNHWYWFWYATMLLLNKTNANRQLAEMTQLPSPLKTTWFSVNRKW